MTRVPTVLLSPARAITLAAAAGVTLLVLVGQVAGGSVGPSAPFAELAVLGVPCLALGVLVLMHEPRHLVGILMTAAGGLATATLLAVSWSEYGPASWLAQWPWIACFSLMFLAVLFFPDGHLPSPRWRPVAICLIASTSITVLALAVAAADQPRLLTDPEASLAPWAGQVVWVAVGGAAVTVVAYPVVLLSFWSRWRRGSYETRHQLACLLLAGLLFLAGIVLDILSVPGAEVLLGVAFPLGMTIAILRYHLYDLDLVVNRTIVWVAMTLLLVGGFVLIVRVAHALFLELNTNVAPLVATGLLAVAFQPLHARVQRAVDHLLYGERSDPYAVVGRLGNILEHTVEATEVLPLLTRTIADSLQVPYVAVELEERSGAVRLVEHGRPATATESFDMTSHGERVGRLVVARRSPGQPFSRRECRLLRNLALQAAVAAEATRLTRDLQSSRERLVLAREEERRRLRRDLHDGVGPTLAGMSMQVHAVRRLQADDGRPAQILDELAESLQICKTEVRQLVDQLRPPALDEGLAMALRSECRRFGDGALSIRLDIDGEVEPLPAAIEVAAYRIVAEALTNVVRHSRASSCRVTVRRAAALTVEVSDDGVGLPDRGPKGVGLTSMKDRAEEVGGSLEMDSGTGRGTTIRVELPLDPQLPRPRVPDHDRQLEAGMNQRVLRG
jgi:signal transduction histidine kinase